MPRSTPLIRMTALSLAAGILGAGQSALAHTVIKDEGKEGTSLHTALLITHGCAGDHSSPTIPVIAQSVLFPNNADSVWTRLKADGTDFGPTTLQATIEGEVLGISPNLMQDKSVFNQMREVADPTVKVGPHGVPNVRAFKMTAGKLQTDLVGAIPFSVSGISFKKSSCARSLKVRIAIANWCSKSQTPNQDNRVDVWMGNLAGRFNDPGVMPEDFQTDPFWPTLTIKRTSKLPARCGNGFDVAVEPSPADINKYLPIQGFWPTP